MANTAIIGIANLGETRSSLLGLAVRMEAGEQTSPGDYHLNFADTLHLLSMTGGPTKSRESSSLPATRMASSTGTVVFAVRADLAFTNDF